MARVELGGAEAACLTTLQYPLSWGQLPCAGIGAHIHPPAADALCSVLSATAGLFCYSGKPFYMKMIAGPPGFIRTPKKLSFWEHMRRERVKILPRLGKATKWLLVPQAVAVGNLRGI